MNLEDLRFAVLGEHTEHTSRWQAAQRGLAAVRAGLEELASLGHHLEVEFTAAARSFPEWPKMLYHADKPATIFEEPTDVVESGWFEHPNLAAETEHVVASSPPEPVLQLSAPAHEPIPAPSAEPHGEGQ